MANEHCGVGGFCSMNQEDSYPPQSNSIGDACDCEGNFDCDADTDGSDAATLKADFGRSSFDRPCIAGDTCNGDFSIITAWDWPQGWVSRLILGFATTGIFTTLFLYPLTGSANTNG